MSDLPSRTTVQGGRRKRRASGWLWLLGLLGLALLLGVLYIRSQLAAPQGQPSPAEFEILPGWGASRVAAELERSQLVKNAELFGLYLRYRGLERNLGEGLYDLDRSMDAAQIAEVLERGGRPRTVFVVLPEGFRLRDVATRLSEAGFGSASDLLELMESPGALAPEGLPPGASLEGYLFPAGYELRVRSSPEAVLEQFLARMDEEIERFAAEREAAGWSVHEWLTLASMIQAEAADHEEMPVIAGVFLNRLERDMPLQSDPTVAYGLGKNLTELSALEGDLQQDHPWNTYTRTGLPVGPINNPSSDALAAVFAPQRSDAEGRPYLYFLHGFDGDEPVFRPNLTLEDHERDIELYLR